MGQILSQLLQIFYTKKLDIVVIGLENRWVDGGTDFLVTFGLTSSFFQRQNYSFVCIGPWGTCLLYTSPSPRDLSTSRMPSSA